MTSTDVDFLGHAFDCPVFVLHDCGDDDVFGVFHELLALAVSAPAVVTGLASLAGPITRLLSFLQAVEEDNVGSPCKSPGTGWSAVDAGRVNPVEEGRVRRWVSALKSGPAF